MGRPQPWERIVAPVLADVWERMFPEFQVPPGAADPRVAAAMAASVTSLTPRSGSPVSLHEPHRLSSRCLEGSVLSLVPIPADEGHTGSEKQWDLHKDTQQVSVRLAAYQTPYQVLFALHPFASDAPGLSVRWRYMRPEQGLHSLAPVLSSSSLTLSLPVYSDNPGFLLLYKSTDFFSPNQRF